MMEFWMEYGEIISWGLGVAAVPTASFLLPAKYAGVVVSVLQFGVDLLDRLAKTKGGLSSEKEGK